MAESGEEGIPLRKASAEAPKSSSSAAGIFLSKLKVILILIGIAVLIIIIIILAVLLSKEKERDKGKTDKEGSDKPTIPPTLPPGPWDNIRLPRTIVPSHYDLHLNVDPNKEGFSGKEKIVVNVENITSHIIIHSHLLNVTKATVTKKDSSGVGIKSRFHVKKTSFLVLETEEPLEGHYILDFEFSGFYRKGLFGLFKGVYRQNTGKTAVFLSTQLQPLDARTIFPCFDEPAFKATFTISLAYPKDMVGLSNNEVEKEETIDDTKTTHFKITPKMSTYLVSVAVGDFESRQLKTTSGVLLRAFAQPGNTDQMDFSLKMGNETLTQMENTFGIKYPMKKLDFVAPPECFIAMENWGSIRFEEDGLLYKKDFSSEEIQQNLLIRWLPHEIIHMWFGNLVTMEWWNDLWLNEAVTDFFTYHDGSPKSLDSWKRSEQFVHTNLGYALGIDGLVNTRPVVEPTNIPNWDTFDNIVYKKGSSLLNMLKNIYPQQANYNKGMKTYLERHSYGNAVGSDMWDALKSTCLDKECANFTEFMNTWMTETNYPVLTVKKGDGGKYIVQQERFVYDRTAKVDKRMWLLRFSYIMRPTNESDSLPSSLHNVWMNTPIDKNATQKKPIETAQIDWDGRGWIKGNFRQNGFYRVNYEDQTWRHLSHQLVYKHDVFPATDRYGLIDDAFNLARGERVSIKRAMDITKYINKEREYLPWMAVYKNLQYIIGILPSDSAVNQHLKKYLAYQSKSFYDILGFQNTGSHLDKLLRKTVVEFQCQSGSKSCLSNMTEMFKKWKKDPLTTSLTPALRSLVYFYGVRHGSVEDWELMLKQLYKNTIASEFQPLLYGLAGSRDIGVLNRYLVLMHNQSIVKQQYLKYVLDDVANHNPVGPDIMRTYIKFNWDKIKGSNPVDAMLQYLQITTKRFSKSNQLKDLENFIETNLNGEPMPRLLRKTIEIVKLNIAWRKAHESDLEQWLLEFFKSKSIPVGNDPGFTNS